MTEGCENSDLREFRNSNRNRENDRWVAEMGEVSSAGNEKEKESGAFFCYI